MNAATKHAHSNNPNNNNLTTLLSATLSTIIHHLLLSRCIYPPESFLLHRHLGVRCYASRIPPVGEYIDEFLSVAVPAVVAGVGKELILVIMEECEGDGGMGEDGKVLERFVFEFGMDRRVLARQDGWSMHSPIAMDVAASDDGEMDIEDVYRFRQSEAVKFDAVLTGEARARLEYSMRQCLLRVLALPRRRRRIGETPENMSFKLCMRTLEGQAHPQQSEQVDGTQFHGGEMNKAVCQELCPQLMEVLKEGQWFEPPKSSCLFTKGHGSQVNEGGNERGLFRPLKDVNLPNCGMRITFGMEVTPF
ncbi:hypothetical protein HJC23_003359 [Cyclotella cryptica]|uniref:HORMA domain-containing protein n=1 Tax=Cyclotella cryptica TaxID=29204 RepID=A0ABD3QZY7_9STRA|eukprot:CCRYP_000931-RA/>CCRYP_000931-RA protein AED:0.00 eAED:0.00 QI:405/-1/1/1/-1/1/1/105/305